MSYIKCLLFLCYLMYFVIVGYSTATTSRYETKNTECSTIPWHNFIRKEDFPNPQLNVDFSRCGRRCLKSWICDPSHSLTSEQGNALDREIENIRTSGICVCSPCTNWQEGYKIAIAISSTILPADRGGETLNQIALEFASYLRGTKWKYGSCENDAVIFVSANDNLVQTATGYMTRKVLDHHCLQKIQNETEALMQHGDMAGALTYMVSRFGQVFRFKICDPQQQKDSGKSTNVMLIAIFGALIALFIVFIVSRFLHRQGFCKKEQRYGINLPPMTLTIREPNKHRKRRRNNKLPADDSPKNITEGSKPDVSDSELQRLETN